MIRREPTILQHEAGHFLMARALRIKGWALILDEDGYTCRTSPPLSAWPVRLAVASLQSGIASEMIVMGHAHISWSRACELDHFGSHDKSVIADLVAGGAIQSQELEEIFSQALARLLEEDIDAASIEIETRAKGMDVGTTAIWEFTSEQTPETHAIH